MSNFKVNQNFLIYVNGEKEFNTAIATLNALGYNLTTYSDELEWSGQKYIKYSTWNDYIWGSSCFEQFKLSFENLQKFLEACVAAPQTEALRAAIAHKEKELEQLRKQLENM